MSPRAAATLEQVPPQADAVTEGAVAVLPVEPLVPPEAFRKALASWYAKHARELPWRGISNAYATWVSEIMLQQTRVATVLERYGPFLRRYPTLAALAAAPEDAVLALWSGLGYYRRARLLHRGAQFVMRELNGQLPKSAGELRALPGVGEYTAAAIASIAFGQSVAVLDGNVERVLLRLLGLPEERTAERRTLLLQTANALVPPAPARRGARNVPGDHNQAMMELGATICLPRSPLCLQCPVLAFCKTRGEHGTPPRKGLRSRQIACLLATRKQGTRTEILLERRASEASLMPGMLELPALPLEAASGREPILRVRHSITDTNYYVEVYAEAATEATAPTPEETEAPGAAQMRFAMPAEHTPEVVAELHPGEPANDDETVYVAQPDDRGRGSALRAQLPVRGADLRWTATQELTSLPLTGLARKVLQRLGLMRMDKVHVGQGRLV